MTTAVLNTKLNKHQRGRLSRISGKSTNENISITVTRLTPSCERIRFSLKCNILTTILILEYSSRSNRKQSSSCRLRGLFSLFVDELN